MRINRWISVAASVGAVGWCLMGAAARAQEVEARVRVTGTDQGDVLYLVDDSHGAPPPTANGGPTQDVLIHVDQPVGDGELHIQALDGAVGESKFWIGVMCQPVDEPLRAQLNLTDGAGVIVGEVLPDSPAAKSGLKKYDVIVSAGDARVADAGALTRVVEANGPKELKVHVIRVGQPAELTIVPAERAQVGAAPVPPVPVPPDRVYRLLQRFQNQEGGPVMRLFHPGAVAPPPQAVPDNVDVRIEKHGNKPAKIHVEQDGKTWDVNENDLSELPEGLRGPIGRLVGQGETPFVARFREGDPRHEEFNIKVVPPPATPPQVVPLPPGVPPVPPQVRERVRAFTERFEGEVGQPGERLEKRLEQLNERLDRLQELIDRLQKQEPKPEAAPPTP